MAWFMGQRRVPAWKKGWGERALESLAPPPLPLIAIFGIIFLLLGLSSYINYRLQVQQTMNNVKLFLLFLPLLLIFAAWFIGFLKPRTTRVLEDVAGSLPWGVTLLVLLLLLLVYYQSRFQSMWSPSF